MSGIENEIQEILTISLTEEDTGKRLDKALADHAPEGVSRARIQALLEEGKILYGDQPVKSGSVKVKPGQVYHIQVPPPVAAVPVAQDIVLDIVYEDDDLLVINKPAGMVVHPAAGNEDGTLVNALLAHCGDSLSGIGGVRRPGIVHRLDKETSGLMIVAKNDAAHQGLSEQLSSRDLSRVYLAVVWGRLSPASGVVETQIARSKTNRKKMTVVKGGGKEAVTEYDTRETFGTLASLVECRLKTGRTHQIRVHMAHLQHWLVGDPVYKCPSARKYLKRAFPKPDATQESAMTDFPRQALHAQQISFVHPRTGENMTFSADLPDDMQNLISALRSPPAKQ